MKRRADDDDVELVAVAAMFGSAMAEEAALGKSSVSRAMALTGWPTLML